MNKIMHINKFTKMCTILNDAGGAGSYAYGYGYGYNYGYGYSNSYYEDDELPGMLEQLKSRFR